MEECPQCGQIPGPEDKSCPHCGFPFDEAAQGGYRSPHLKKIEEEILSQVIARVESYWSAQRAEDAEIKAEPNAAATAPPAEPAQPAGGRGLAMLLRWLAWIHLGLGLAAGGVLWHAAGSSGAGYATPLLGVLCVFFGIAGCAALLALAVLLQSR